MQLLLLPGFLAQLQNYGEGASLKTASMEEVAVLLKHLKLSRRAFLRQAQALGYKTSTVTSLGNWISCRHIPTAANIDQLLDALHAVLRQHDHDITPWRDELRESSFIHAHSLAAFRQDARNLERAKEMLDATIAWADVAEFPPTAGLMPAHFVPMTREHSIQCLEILRQIHFRVAKESSQPRAIEHQLVAAKAAIVLAHHLNITGYYAWALEAADEGSHALGEILAKHPKWAEQVVEGHTPITEEPITLADVEVMGLGRKLIALQSLVQSSRSAGERNHLNSLIAHTFAMVIPKARQLSAHPYLESAMWRTRALFYLDTANSSDDLEQAAQYIQCAVNHLDGPSSSLKLLYQYVTLLTQVEAMARLGQIDRASGVLAEAEQVEQIIQRRGRLVPGPAYQVIRWRTLAFYWLAHAQAQSDNSPQRREYGRRWRDAANMALQMVQDLGLSDQERRLHLVLNNVDTEYLRLLAQRDR